ncbi:MAG: nucleoside recognition domain-containing protein [Methanocellales archaeon]|nr:nucleoside recognition domain-containing protein [Methanocellales archaeon]MDD5447005.1 nucleoside recognition domain-containing protein [Methanocellales archaeon]
MPVDDELADEQRWAEIGRIIGQVQTITHRHHTFLERIGDASIKPLTGSLIAMIVLLFTFQLIRLVGEGLIDYVFEPIFDAYTPLVMKLSELLGPGFVHDILIGTLIGGKIDYVQSMGLLTTGFFVPFAMVLPYVFAFYLVLGFLEDCGYLPRLAVLMDSLMHKIGLHGLSIVSFLLGLGCNVPGALSTRILDTKKQVFIAATLMAIAVPCMAQIAMVVGLVGKYGAKGLGIVLFTLFMVWVVLGYLLNKILKGKSPEIFMEIPPYRIPYWGALLKKLWMRIRSFIMEAVPYVLLGVFVINIIYVLGIIEFIGQIFSPIMVGLLGLPAEAAAALVVGLLRKDVAMGMLLPLGLTMSQAIVASVVLAMYFPCIATFVVLTKELGIVDTTKSAAIMITSTLLVGGLLNIIL